MNRQDIWKDNRRIKRGIEWTSIHDRPGWTANPVRGCKHECRWRMPDGSISKCYAEEIANGIAASAYPGGFQNLTFDSREIMAISKLKEPAGIFIDSMSDLLGASVPPEWVEKTIACMTNNPQHVFFLLTKQPGNLAKFKFPKNVLVGVSAPPTFMFGKELTHTQQYVWLNRALMQLAECDCSWRWVSLEPLSFDVSEIIRAHRGKIDWAVIGAATQGPKRFQPSEAHLSAAVAALADRPIFFKGNLSYTMALRVVGSWREEFPAIGMNINKQESLF